MYQKVSIQEKGKYSRIPDSETHLSHQGKSLSAVMPAQLTALEEPLQGKFKIAQLAGTEEEEPIQGKFTTVQLAGIEEEMPAQGKFKTAQLAGIEEEMPAQGKFKTAQLAAVEEEMPIQGKFAITQFAGMPEEELPVQGRFLNPNVASVVQKQKMPPNSTGMPDQLKSGLESMSGFAMDDVKVHYNSDKPQQLQAHAYAQGTDIHIAPGQEQHLPHEAWHVVQQKQGRVQPTIQMKEGVQVNDDRGLENEADVMGVKAFEQGKSRL